MKRILSIIALALLVLHASAIDELQIKPFVTTAGITNDEYEYYMELNLVNESFDVANLQFDLLLPEGMEYMDYEFDTRVPYTRKKIGGVWVPVFDFSIQTNELASGYTRFMFIPGGEMRKIQTGSGSIMYIYFTTSEAMTPGIYPIKMTNIKLVESVTSAIELNDVVSYVFIGDATSMKADWDMSTLTGTMPSFIVDALNTDMQTNTNLRSINLSGVSAFAADLEVPNNVLCTLAEGTSLHRTFPAEQWSTICLPFALDVAQVSAIKGKGCEIMQLTGYSETGNSVSFDEVTAMAANTPYLIKSETAQMIFENLEEVVVGDMSSTIDIQQGKMSMVGSFEKKIISSDDNTTYFAYDASNGEFVRIGSNATVRPFRAYLALNGVSNANSLALDTDGEGTTKIEAISNGHSEDAVYTLQGLRTAGQERGIYIRNGKKFIIK